MSLTTQMERAGNSRLGIAVYAVGALCLLWPWLGYGYLFAADEYLHTYNACILDRLLSGDDGGYAEWYAVNYFPEPNLMGHALLVVLSQVMPMVWAEKVIVGLLGFGVGYAFLRRSAPLTLGAEAAPALTIGSLWRAGLALLALSFVLAPVMQYGFVNYLLGMVGMQAALTHTGSKTAGARWSIAIWALLLYFCHPIALLFFMGVVALRELLHRGLMKPSLLPQRGNYGRFVVDMLRWFVVPLALFAAYTTQHGGETAMEGASLRRLGAFLLYFRELTLYGVSELPFALLTLALSAIAGIAATVWVVTRKGAALTVAAVGLVVLLAAIVLVPDQLAGGAYIYQRLRPFVWVWALWVGAHSIEYAWHQQRASGILQSVSKLLVKPAFAYAIAIGAVAAAVGFTVVRVPASLTVAAELDELQTFAQQIPEGAVVLPVSAVELVNGQENFTSPYHHFAGVAGCDRGIVLLDNYEATVGYFPLVWQEGRDPLAAMTRSAEAHPAVIPQEGRAWFASNAEYILSRGPLSESLAKETADWLAPALGAPVASASGTFYLFRIDATALSL